MADAGSIGRQTKGPSGSLIKTPPALTYTGIAEPIPNKGVRAVSGTVSVLGTAAGGLLVRAYAKVSGELVGFATTAGDGTYSIKTGYFDEVYVVAFDPTTYQALVYDQIVPG